MNLTVTYQIPGYLSSSSRLRLDLPHLLRLNRRQLWLVDVLAGEQRPHRLQCAGQILALAGGAEADVSLPLWAEDHARGRADLRLEQILGHRPRVAAAIGRLPIVSDAG